MKKFWNRNNGGLRNEITLRRRNMKKLIGVGIVTGLAVAAIFGTMTILSTTDVAESVTKSKLEVKSERVAPNFVDFNGGVYAGTE